MTRPVLLDTDIGSDADDAIALVLLLALADSLDLVAVTTVSDNPGLRAQIASRLLGAAGKTEVEVCAGVATPLAAGSFEAFGHESQCLAPGEDALIQTEPAPERIVRAAREHEGLELVAIGPLSNFAAALAIEPDLPRRVAGLTIMGGHIRAVRIGDYLCSPGIDYNLCSDPAASVSVLGAGFNTTLVTADVTLETWLTESELAQIESASPLGARLGEQIRLWAPVQKKLFEGMGGRVAEDNVAFLHDPLTVLSLADTEGIRFESLHVVPTIVDGTLRTFEVDAALGIGSVMRVATAVEGAAVSRRIAKRLLEYLAN